MDTYRLILQQYPNGDYEIGSMHEQTGSANGIRIDKTVFEQLRDYFCGQVVSKNGNDKSPIQPVNNCVRLCTCPKSMPDYEDSSMCGLCGDDISEHGC